MRRGRLRSEPRPGADGFSTRRQPISKASEEQRDKVRDGACLVCGNLAPVATIDPAHLWPRAHGGCDLAACVVALCRFHHRQLDERRLDLLPHLIPHHGEEVAHAVEHANGDLISVLERLTGGQVTVSEAGEGG